MAIDDDLYAKALAMPDTDMDKADLLTETVWRIRLSILDRRLCQLSERFHIAYTPTRY